MPWPWSGIVYAAEWVETAKQALQVAQTSGTPQQRMEAEWEVERALTEYELADATISAQWFGGLRRALKNTPGAVQTLLADLPVVHLLQSEHQCIADAIVDLEDRANRLEAENARLWARDAARERQVRELADAVAALEADRQGATCG